MDTKEQKPEMTREWETWLNMSGSWCMPLMRPQPLSQRLSWLTSTKFWKTTMAARQNAAMRRLEDFQDGEVWLMVKLGDLNPARLLVKRRLQKLDAEHSRQNIFTYAGPQAWTT